MVRLTWSALALTGLIAIACAGGANVGRSTATPDPNSYDDAPTAQIANAAVAGTDGKIVALASFSETRLGVRVEIKALGLPPGKHGTHIHGVGKCEAPDFASAGGHFNINNKQHGVPGATGSHAGELPNLEIGADGKGALLFYSPHLSLNKAQSNGLTFGAGTAVIIHAQEDDYATQPAGNSGARIACGVVKVPS